MTLFYCTDQLLFIVQINYCVRTGSMAGPVLPPIKRPPFVRAPKLPPRVQDAEVLFDVENNVWLRNPSETQLKSLGMSQGKQFLSKSC